MTSETTYVNFVSLKFQCFHWAVFSFKRGFHESIRTRYFMLILCYFMLMIMIMIMIMIMVIIIIIIIIK